MLPAHAAEDRSLKAISSLAPGHWPARLRPGRVAGLPASAVGALPLHTGRLGHTGARQTVRQSDTHSCAGFTIRHRTAGRRMGSVSPGRSPSQYSRGGHERQPLLGRASRRAVAVSTGHPLVQRQGAAVEVTGAVPPWRDLANEPNVDCDVLNRAGMVRRRAGRTARQDRARRLKKRLRFVGRSRQSPRAVERGYSRAILCPIPAAVLYSGHRFPQGRVAIRAAFRTCAPGARHTATGFYNLVISTNRCAMLDGVHTRLRCVADTRPCHARAP